MTELQFVQRQVARILDEADQPQVDVIVQMKAPNEDPARPLRATGEALARRRLSLTPRDPLPALNGSSQSKSTQPETASLYSIMDQATSETLTLARVQSIGRSAMSPLLKNGLVGEAMARMSAPSRKGGANGRVPKALWTSRAMPLRLTRDELSKLPEEVTHIKAIHHNRRLCIPTTMETRPLALEENDLLSAVWGLDRCNALAAWGAYGARGKGTVIGLIDTGVDATHPDLKGKVKHWVEFDSLGKSFKSEPRDSDEHGTHCAGTLVGGNASGRFIGVAPEAKLAVALALDGEAGGTDAQVLAAIDWAAERRVDVISMSLGGLCFDASTPPTYTEAIYTCNEAGIPVVVAIGNEGHQTSGSPGNDLFALSVGAIDERDRVAGFSGGRTQIIRHSEYIDERHLPLPYSKPDLTAPGVAIRSSVPKGKWKALNGTSMATPHVAGAIAALLGATAIRKKEKGLRRTNLIQDLICGAVNDLGESGQDQRYGFGSLNILRAIDFARQRGY